MLKQGLAIHCHHNALVEHCYDYDNRVAVIKSTKPKNEQEIRLRLFKLLPTEAIAELPKGLVKACAEWNKAYAEWDKARAEWDKARAEWDKARAEWDKAYAEWDKAYAKLNKARAEWDKARAELDKARAELDKAEETTWHSKWCGCKEWNGREIIF